MIDIAGLLLYILSLVVNAGVPEPYAEPSRQTLSYEGSIAELICSYDWPCEEALYVSWHESGHQLWVLNYEGSGACGLFQTLPCVGYGDIEANLDEAYRKWLACNGGSFWCAWYQWW